MLTLELASACKSHSCSLSYFGPSLFSLSTLLMSEASPTQPTDKPPSPAPFRPLSDANPLVDETSESFQAEKAEWIGRFPRFAKEVEYGSGGDYEHAGWYPGWDEATKKTGEMRRLLAGGEPVSKILNQPPPEHRPPPEAFSQHHPPRE